MHLENQKPKAQKPKAKKENLWLSTPAYLSVRAVKDEWVSHFFHQIFYHMFAKLVVAT